MMQLRIIRLGHPKLRLKSKKVSVRELKTERFQLFLDKLTTTCIRSKGVGIAAPQVGVNKRVIVVFVEKDNPRYPDKKPFPLTILINPTIIRRDLVKKEDWEGDLSADLRALVPRAVACTISGMDRDGNVVVYELSDDFHARVFQHEIDHLDGILFIDKVKRKDSISETAMWRRYLKKKRLAETD